ncbi:MAG: hypothetical protein GX683_03965 [Ruminococcaceae bacterium]|nr:hypothetical protein [Oscillospiraceae bacterium]
MKIRREYKAALAAVVLSACLCGCTFSYGDRGVARFVSPTVYGGDAIVPAEAPSVKQGKKEVANAALLSDTIFTVDAQYEIDESYFVHEEFYFMLPTGWREHLVFTSKVVTITDHDVRAMDFFYRVEPSAAEVAEGADEDVRLMQIECVETSLLQELDIYSQKELIGTSADGRYSYYITYYENLIPGEKEYSAACVNILGTMMSERGRITLKV